MIQLLAVAVLTLASLAHIQLGQPLTTKLENKLAIQANSHSLLRPDPHLGSIQPVRTGTSQLGLGAVAVIAQDVASNAVLYQKNTNSQLPIASITKLATALVILQRHSLDEVVTIPSLPAYGAGDEHMGLVPGEKLTVGDLLKATLIQSANDAADALAIADAGTKTAFSARMNRLISAWGLEHTRFSNPSGLSDEGNYSSAADLAKLAKLALLNPTLRQIVTQSTATIADSSGKSFVLKNTNKLLSDSRFHGVKTGYTLASGQSFIGLATINGHDVITVVLNSPDRFGETAALADWLQKEYLWL